MQDVREYGNDELVALVPLPADDANKYTRGTLTAVVYFMATKIGRASP